MVYVSFIFSINPHQEPLINNLVKYFISLYETSSNNFNLKVSVDFNKFNSLNMEYPVVISQETAKCLCNPMFPPSGESTGSINPHCEAFNNLGPTTFAVGSSGTFIFLL